MEVSSIEVTATTSENRRKGPVRDGDNLSRIQNIPGGFCACADDEIETGTASSTRQLNMARPTEV